MISKKFVIGVTFVFTCCVASASGGDVIAYWPFGAHGLKDMSGNGNHLVSNGSGSFLGTGVSIGYEGQLVLDGTQTKLNTGAIDLSPYSAYTVECWVRTPDVQSALQMILELSEDSGLVNGSFYLDLNESGAGSLLSSLRVISAYGHNQDTTPPNAMHDFAWHHAALVVTSTADGADQAKLYFDGEQQATFGSYTASAAMTFPSDKKLYVGSRANAKFKFIGELDEVRITGRALDTSEFLQRVRGDTIAFWPFGACGGADVSGNGNDLVTTGLTFTNGAVQFDGGQMKCSTKWPLDLRDCADGVTIEFWIKTTSTALQMLIEHTELASHGAHPMPGAFYVSVNEVGGVGSGHLRGMIKPDGGGFYIRDSASDTSYNDGEWHHVALVASPQRTVSERMKFYVDGNLCDVTPGYDVPNWDNLRNAYFYLGSRSNAMFKYVGELDDVRITSGAFTTNEFHMTRTDDSASYEIPDPPAKSPTLAHWTFTSDGRDGGWLEDKTGAFTLYPAYKNDVDPQDGAAVFKRRNGLLTDWPIDLTPFDAITVECRVKTVVTNAPMNLIEMSANYNNNAGSFVLSSGQMKVDEPGAGVRVQDGYNIQTAAKGLLSDGVWHHVAYVMDRTVSGSDWTRFYIDGQLAGSTFGGFDKGVGPTLFGRDRLYLGFRAMPNGGARFMGEMDDVRISAAALEPIQFLNANAAPRTEYPVETGVLAFWTFNDGTAADTSGHSCDLTVTGDVIFTNKFATFGVNHGMLQTASKLPFSKCEAFTVECFVKVPTMKDAMFVQSGTYSTDGEFYFGIEQNYTRSGVRASYSGSNVDQGRPDITDGNWHHVALVVDRRRHDNDFARLYVDGAKMYQHTGYAAHNLDAFSDVILTLGKFSVNNDYDFEGGLDDVRITGRALVPAEFLTAPTVDVVSEVIAYWPFNARDPLADKSGNGHSLTNGGGAVYLKNWDAMSFTGDTNTILRTLSKIDLRGHDAVTFEFYARTSEPWRTMIVTEFSSNADEVPGAFYTFFKEGKAYQYYSTSVFAEYPTGVLRHKSNSDVSAEVINAGQWHHYAVVVDKTKFGDERAILYVDSVPCAAVHDTTKCDDNAPMPFEFLNFGVRAGTKEFAFTGEIDDVRITGAALTPSQFLMQRSQACSTVITIR